MMSKAGLSKSTSITTIKISRQTKQRLEKLRSYKRETYDELLQKVLEILTTSKFNPDRARMMLLSLDRKHTKIEKSLPPKKDTAARQAKNHHS